MKRKSLAYSIILLLTLAVTACAKPNTNESKSPLPSAQTVLTEAVKSNFKTMRATWRQTNAEGKVLQKTEAKYNHQPLVLYANFTTNSNHYQIWLNHKASYVKMQGTATNQWFKTKLSKSSSYAQLTDDAAKAALLSFTDHAKLFKVKQTNGYQLTYQGTSGKIWHDISGNNVITSIIGLDLNEVKPAEMKVKIAIDKKYQLQAIMIDAAYHESGSKKHLQFSVDQINKLPALKIPSKIQKAAIDLGKWESKNENS